MNLSNQHNGDVELDEEVDPHELMAFVSKDPNEANIHKELSFDTILAAVYMYHHLYLLCVLLSQKENMYSLSNSLMLQSHNFQLDTTQRISSITNVLAHYEAEVSTPFSVLGIAMTQEVITLVTSCTFMK
jgi:hypothetical protein